MKVSPYFHYLDINECKTNNGGCQHSCSNTVGSYSCTCNGGYELHSDEETCDGKKNEIIIIIHVYTLVRKTLELCYLYIMQFVYLIDHI